MYSKSGPVRCDEGALVSIIPSTTVFSHVENIIEGTLKEYSEPFEFGNLYDLGQRL